MLIESTHHVGLALGMLQSVFKAPSGAEISHIILRWLHFVAGITWIGLLYFFNLVNVPLQKKLDADTKKKVNPDLLLPALWYFRWGALVTVLAGFGYYAMYILRPDVGLANATGANVSGRIVLIVWFFIPIITFLIEFLIIKKVAALIKDGRVFAVVAAILFAAMGFVIIKWLDGSLTVNGQHFASNKTLSIGVGGAFGLIMLLNVWGIIWPNNKRSLFAMQGGPAVPPEQAPALARQAFIASRTNAWLSLPMLLFMGTSHGDWLIFGGR
ncbi:MAG TPA: urate hydroxylase PuuD [Pyrinomonadaceae bacterium]|nr:urate hydroxylase PuuD [Pyrinomonadaceae bacterium]